MASPVADRLAEFERVALSSSLAAAEVKTELRLEVRRAALRVSVACPEKALGELAGLVRELLK